MGRTKVPTSKASASKATASKRDKRKRPNYEPTFYNDEAKKFFEQHLKTREGVRERGITAQYSGITNIVQRRGWQRFAEQPEAAVLDVVREFYANARVQYRYDIHVRKVLVRGQDVFYDRKTINSYYGLQDYEEDEYSAWLAEGPDMDEVIARLTFEGSRWRMYHGHPVSFPRGALTFISRGWHYFISAKLLPSNHVSDVNKDRALLNFAIQSRMTIDVGKIIEASILSCCQGRATQHLVHPSLIYQLCVQAGVGSVDEEEQMPLPPINDYTMELLEKTSKAGRKEKVTSPIPETAPPVQEEPITSVGPDQERPMPHASTSEMPTPSTPAPVRPDTTSSLEATLRGFQIQLDELKKGQKMMFDELMKGQKKMKKKLDYIMDFNLGIAKTMYKAKLIDNYPEIHLPNMPSDSSWSSTEEESRRDEPEDGGNATRSEDAASKAAIPEDVGRSHLTGDSHDEDSGAGSHNEEYTEDEEEGHSSGSQAMEVDEQGSGDHVVEVGEQSREIQTEETVGQAEETVGQTEETVGHAEEIVSQTEETSGQVVDTSGMEIVVAEKHVSAGSEEKKAE